MVTKKKAAVAAKKAAAPKKAVDATKKKPAATKKPAAAKKPVAAKKNVAAKKTAAAKKSIPGAPKIASLDDKDGAEVLTASGTNRAPRKRGRKAAVGINLKSVAEALVIEGLDPAVEFARILKAVEHVDPDTGETSMKHQLDPDTRARMLSEILQYTQPKLKAVEVKMTGSLDLLSEEQLDNRLASLLSKARR